jgi:RimJ/RimL family protein N-acetyltransferase
MSRRNDGTAVSAKRDVGCTGQRVPPGTAERAQVQDDAQGWISVVSHIERPRVGRTDGAPWHDSAFAREMVAVMTVGAPGSEVVLETSRLLLRPWRVAEAVVQRELWIERDPRVPPHRRIDADGHPTVAEIEDSIRTNQVSSTGLLAVERKASRDVIGYCGLVDSGRGAGGEPELAFELLRRVWRQGYATEASLSVLEWARSSGYERLWATVWDWNTASRRVLAKVGFTETDRKEVDAVHGTTLFTTRRL